MIQTAPEVSFRVYTVCQVFSVCVCGVCVCVLGGGGGMVGGGRVVGCGVGYRVSGFKTLKVIR